MIGQPCDRRPLREEMRFGRKRSILSLTSKFKRIIFHHEPGKRHKHQKPARDSHASRAFTIAAPFVDIPSVSQSTIPMIVVWSRTSTLAGIVPAVRPWLEDGKCRFDNPNLIGRKKGPICMCSNVVIGQEFEQYE